MQARRALRELDEMSLLGQKRTPLPQLTATTDGRTLQSPCTDLRTPGLPTGRNSRCEPLVPSLVALEFRGTPTPSGLGPEVAVLA